MESWVAEAAEKLGRAFDAERVLVFGSRARGRATRRSDLDLFVVAETPLRTLDRLDKALKLLADLPCAVDPVVYTPAELEARSGSKFLAHVLATGVVAYERGQAPR